MVIQTFVIALASAQYEHLNQHVRSAAVLVPQDGNVRGRIHPMTAFLFVVCVLHRFLRPIVEGSGVRCKR